uniref:Acyl_transf_3 domain-containing protein n=1 Tax=Ascaris lumbricoides TaxID=6252 RepID=A0A0M3IQE2_ASCLU
MRFFMIISYHLIFRGIPESYAFGRFVAGTLFWSFTYVGDGIVVTVFNRNERRIKQICPKKCFVLKGPLKKNTSSMWAAQQTPPQLRGYFDKPSIQYC